MSYKLTEKHRENLRNSLKESYKKGRISWNKGKHWSEKVKRKMRETQIRIGNKPPSWKGKKQTFEHSEKIRLANIGKKRSPECRQYFSKIMMGTSRHKMPHSEKTKRLLSKICKIRFKDKTKHPMWKGGVTPVNKMIRESLKYKNWRNKVYRRDRWNCQICKKHCEPKNIIAHHLKSFSEFPKSRFITKNGVTLCRNCHARLHKSFRILQEKQQLKLL